jgi:hypothetical protein
VPFDPGELDASSHILLPVPRMSKGGPEPTMSAAIDVAQARALRRAAVAAARAPSFRNSQPWRIVLRHRAVEIHADNARRLFALDPVGRQLFVSCGAALFNARVALAAHQTAVRVVRLPDPTRAEVVARLTPVGAGRIGSSELGRLLPVVDTCGTLRNEFGTAGVSRELIDMVCAAVRAQAVEAVPVPRDRVAAVIGLERAAEARGRVDPSWRTQARSTVSDARRLAPARDPMLVALVTHDDDTLAWIRAGEAYQHACLRLAEAGCAMASFAHAIENRGFRAALRQLLEVDGVPQLLVQVGRPRSTAPNPRRRLTDVLVTAD